MSRTTPEEQHRYNRAYDKAVHHQPFSPGERDLLNSTALRISFRLMQGENPEDLDSDDVAVLQAFGVNPHDHRTWMTHALGCDHTGARCPAFADIAPHTQH